jgi:hypothetical protein
MNTLLDMIAALDAKVQQLAGSIGGGTITVPSLFGRTLGDAKAIITTPAQKLNLGSVIDAAGKLIDTSLTATKSLIVINQVPIAGAKTVPGASVNLVVSASVSGGAPETPELPTIDEIEPDPVNVTTAVNIIGSNFEVLPKENVVTFNGIVGVVSDLSIKGMLIVTVPGNIPQAPTNTSTIKEVEVVVTTKVGTVKHKCNITGPPAKPLPAITAIEPSAAEGGSRVGFDINLTGLNYGSTVSAVTVTFDGVLGAIKEFSPTKLKVTIPNTIPGLTKTGDLRMDVPIVVSVKDVGSSTPPMKYTIDR